METQKELEKLAQKCKKYISCDVAWISKPLNDGKMFFIIGFNKNTEWEKDTITTNEKGEKINYDYVQEKVVASGYNEKELIKSIKEYVKLSKMSWEEYFEEYGLKREKENN